MRSAAAEKQNFKSWLTNKKYDNTQIISVIQAIDRANALYSNADFWSMQDSSDYQGAISALRKSIKIRLFHRTVLDELDQYGAIYAEYLDKRKAHIASSDSPAAYSHTDSTPVTGYVLVEDTLQRETHPAKKEASPALDEEHFLLTPASADFNETENSSDIEEEARTELRTFLEKINMSDQSNVSEEIPEIAPAEEQLHTANATVVQDPLQPDHTAPELAVQPLHNVCALLDAENIPYTLTGSNYIFVEKNAISQSVLRKVKRAEGVVSVTSIFRTGTVCWRIRFEAGVDLTAEQNTLGDIPTAMTNEAKGDFNSKEESITEPNVSPSTEKFDTHVDAQIFSSSQATEAREEGIVPAAASANAPVDTSINTQEDEIMRYLVGKGFKCIDKRQAGGRLWILGDASLRDEMQKLQALGLRFLYARSGSKSIQWQSGWYLYEQGSKLPFAPPVISESVTSVASEEPAQAEEEAPAQPKLERYKLATGSAIYIGDGPSGAFAAFCDDLAINYQGRFQNLIGKRYYGSGPLVLSSTRQAEYTVSLKHCEAYVSSTLTIYQALNYGQWICRQCGELDYPLRVVKCLPGEQPATPVNLVTDEAQAIEAQPQGPDFAPVVSEHTVIGPIEQTDVPGQPQEEALAGITVDIYEEVSVDTAEEPAEETHEELSEEHIEEPLSVDVEQIPETLEKVVTEAEPPQPIQEPQAGYKLATASAAFYGSDPASAFAAYCAYLAKKDPKRFNALLGKQYFGRGPIVLSGTGNDRYSRKVDGTDAYVLDTLSDTYALLFARWLGAMFREAELPTEVVFCKEQPKLLTLKTAENEDIPVEAVETQIPETAPVFAEAAPEALIQAADKSVASQEESPTAVVQTVSSPVHTPVVTAAAEDIGLSDELHSLLADQDLQVLRTALVKDDIVTMDQFSQLDLLDYLNGHNIYGREHRQEIQRRIQGRLAGSGERPEEKRYKLVTDKGYYYGDTQEEAFIAYCDHAAFEHPALFRALLNKKYNNQGRVVFSRERKPDMPLKLNQLNAYINQELSAQHIILYAIWVSKMCNMHETPLRLVDTRSMAATEALGLEATKQNTVSSTATQSTVPVRHEVKVEESTETSRELSSELQDVLKDDDMLILRKNLLRDGILTIEQLQNINLWSYMNRKNLYLSVKKRQEISARIKKRLQQGEKPEEPRFRLVSGATAFSGNTPTLALAAYCEYLSMAYPAKFKNLINKKYYDQGSVVLQSLIPNGKYVKVENVRAYLDGNLNAQAALNYARWLGRGCGDPTAAQLTLVTREPDTPQQKPLSPVSKAPAPAISAAPKPAAPTTKPTPAVTPGAQPQPAVRSGFADYEKRLTDRINELVLQADLDGIELTALADRLRQNVSYTRQLVDRMPQIVQFGDKLIHEESFVDWEEGAEQLEEILGKLLDRNDGYVSAAQLYEYARADMQMFLNDNDMDSERPVYDMAQHLFGKVGYHGKRLSFQSKTHISRKGVEVSSALDVIRNYAAVQDGVIDEEELAQYIQSLGMNTNGLRQTMRIYNQPIFFIYGGGTLLYSESMGMDEDWFDTVRKALENLFADLGDHVVLRDIQRWWFMQLPSLPGGKDWTLPLLQNVLYFYSKQLGARTINAMSGQTYETVHAMLVRLDSEIQSFPDAVAAFLVDSGIPERRFEAEQLRQLLVQRGMIAGGELYTNMPKALAKDFRFAWDADGQHVTIKV